jgi:hypothetical protein
MRDLSLAQKDVSSGVSTGRASSSNTHWRQWDSFTTEMGLDSLLQAVEDKVQILQVFGRRVRTGKLAAGHAAVKSRSVEDYLRSVGQTFLQLGRPDPRLNSSGKVDFRIQRMLSAYTKEDPPPNRVKPVPVPVLRRIFHVASTMNDAHFQCLADMIGLAFFFLLRPGEYTNSPSDSTPFEFRDVQMFRGQQRLNLATASDAQLLTATFASLTFRDQKNGVKGEVVGLGHSGDPFLSPTKILARRIIHLRNNNAVPTTPLCKYFIANSSKTILPKHITESLRDAVTFLGPSLGFLPSDVTARCLRAAGANALLCSNVDTDIIRLLGRWRSDEMLRYLHLQAAPLMSDFSRRMLAGGNFTLIPNQLVPVY